MPIDPRVRLCDGLLFDPWAPSGPAPSPAATARAMSNLCRYGGHVDRPYSVGEHTLWLIVASLGAGRPDHVVRSLRDALVSRSPRWGTLVHQTAWESPDNARLALALWIHDAPEGAGLVDVPSPVRRSHLPEYGDADDRLLRFLCAAWSFPSPDEDGPLWLSAWRLDRAILGPELEVRASFVPSAGGVLETTATERLPGWSWLSLRDRCALERDDPDADERRGVSGRVWVRRALLQAWEALRRALGIRPVAEDERVEIRTTTLLAPAPTIRAVVDIGALTRVSPPPPFVHVGAEPPPWGVLPSSVALDIGEIASAEILPPPAPAEPPASPVGRTEGEVRGSGFDNLREWLDDGEQSRG